MAVKVAINGFGRIEVIFRAGFSETRMWNLLR